MLYYLSVDSLKKIYKVVVQSLVLVDSICTINKLSSISFHLHFIDIYLIIYKARDSRPSWRSLRTRLPYHNHRRLGCANTRQMEEIFDVGLAVELVDWLTGDIDWIKTHQLVDVDLCT